MRLQTKIYAPVGEGIQIDWNPEQVANTIVLVNAPNKMPPFVEVDVVTVGPDVKQVKPNDRVIVNSGQITKMRPVQSEPELYFVKEIQCVAVITAPSFGLREVPEPTD